MKKYRDFVGQHPHQTAYFQPVLDCLDYSVSPLIGSKNCLIMEGKQDFYAMKYFLPALGCDDIDVLPGAGAGNMSALVSLFLGWGRRFLILLDDDKAGRSERDRYIEEYLLDPSQLATFASAGSSLVGRKLESLFSAELSTMVQSHFSLSVKPKKRDFARFFQERLATEAHLDLKDIDDETRNSMQTVAEFVRKRLGSTTS